MRSALFVDFDNVFSALRRLDPAVAERFARQPQQWLEWLSTRLASPPGAPDSTRRVLVRRCYLNPQAYQQYRPAFNRAGFEIVDCPPMTSEGKTSTDIHMVLDTVELLQHSVHYDEFLVFSADADFTPLLRKLRRWDRRSTVLAVGFPSGAYRASADLLIDQDLFIREALGTAVPEQAMVAAPEPPPPGLHGALPGGAEVPSLNDIGAWVRDEWQRHPQAVAGGRVAQRLVERFPVLAGAWAGRSSFRKLAEDLPVAPLRWDWSVSPGYLLPVGAAIPASKSQAPHWPPAWWSTFGTAIGLPELSTAEVQAIVAALSADLRAHPFQLSETGKRVRDHCRDAGMAIARSDVSYVMKGVTFGGHRFDGDGPHGIADLATAFQRSLLKLCDREQFEMNEARQAELARWLGLG